MIRKPGHLRNMSSEPIVAREYSPTILSPEEVKAAQAEAYERDYEATYTSPRLCKHHNWKPNSKHLMDVLRACPKCGERLARNMCKNSLKRPHAERIVRIYNSSVGPDQQVIL